MNWRRSQILGMGAILIGFVLILADVSVLSGSGAFSYFVVVLLAVIAIAFGGGDIVKRRTANGDWWQPVATESGYQVPVPGDELTGLQDAELQERLRQRVIVSLMDELDCSKTDAETHIKEGTWTDDQLAAAYLGPEPIRVPLTTRIRGTLRRTPIEERAVRHTVIALRTLRTKSTNR